MDEEKLSKNADGNTNTNADKTLERLKKFGFEPVNFTFDEQSEPIDKRPSEYDFAQTYIADYLITISNIQETLSELCINGLDKSNMQRVYSNLLAAFRSTRNTINKLPNIDEVLKLPIDLNEKDRLQLITYECNNDGYKMDFFEYYTKITVPKLHSRKTGKKPSMRLLAVKSIMNDTLNGMFIRHKDRIPIIDRATVVVDAQGDVDPDNLDVKNVIDCFKGYFIFSDEGSMLDLHIICSGKVKDKTEFYMMKREDFPRFLNDHKELF